MVALTPVPVVVAAPGVLVKVQLPEEGNPSSKTTPFVVHVGCVIDLTTGALGVVGCRLISTLAEAADIHPAEFLIT
jgi:hypothetical protein